MRLSVSTLALVAAVSAAPIATAQDLSSIVARAREQNESGSYAAALKTLERLPAKGLPKALAIDAALLETTASLVERGPEAAAKACAKAIVAADYDPEVARELSPKVRSVCADAATSERGARLDRAGVKVTGFTVQAPEVAWRPVRVQVDTSAAPKGLRMVARVTSSALEGSFDLALAPSVEGPLRGTLDAAWIRPTSKLEIDLIAQDKFGDLGAPIQSTTLAVPAVEAMVLLGEVDSDARVTVDGDAVKVGDAGGVPVSPGSHTIALALPSGASASTRVDVKQGNIVRVALSPQRPNTARTLAWVATGTTVALGAVGGVLMLTADGQRAEIEALSAKREPGSDLPATSYADIRSKDDERKLFTNIGAGLLIAGAVTGAAAITLWLLPSGGSSSTHDKSAGLTVRPIVGLGGAGISGSW